MKRGVPLLAILLSGCSQTRAERREALACGLLAPVAAGFWYLDKMSNQDPWMNETMLADQRDHPPDGRNTPR